VSDSVFVGIDVSSQVLEVASRLEAKTWQASNDVAGIEQLVEQLAAIQPALVVLEATGGYEFEAACALQASGLAVAVVNPRAARDFARAMGALAKTDALDARMLAAFAGVLHRHPERERFVKPLADAELQRLQALVLRRRQLVQMLTSEASACAFRMPRLAPASSATSSSCGTSSRTATPKSLRTSAAPTQSSPPRWPACRASARPVWRCCSPSCPNSASSTDAASLPSSARHP